MNQEIKDVILRFTRSKNIIACLQLAELTDIEDFTKFNQSDIDILENYIRSRSSIMDVNSRKLYLNKEYIHYPEKFMFTPGIRNRLLKAAKHISKDVYNTVYESDKSDSVDSKILSLKSNNSLNPEDKIENGSTKSNNDDNFSSSKFSNQFLTTPVLVKTENFERARHFECLEKYYKDISKNASKNFENCILQPRIDFQITIPEDDPTNLNGLFHCILCTHRRSNPTIIKFRFSKYNSVIYTNIISHLKVHFQYILDSPERKRRRISKSDIVDAAQVTDEDVIDLNITNEKFES